MERVLVKNSAEMAALLERALSEKMDVVVESTYGDLWIIAPRGAPYYVISLTKWVPKKGKMVLQSDKVRFMPSTLFWIAFTGFVHISRDDISVALRFPIRLKSEPIAKDIWLGEHKE